MIDEVSLTAESIERAALADLHAAATHPDHRKKGSQGASLRRRICDARDSGCRLLLTATGEEIPGDPQRSYRNILRHGFEPAYLRENFLPSPRR